MNPFVHGVTVSGKDFCPRTDLIRELKGYVASGNNCVVRGVRRIGKTSAVMEAVRRSKRAQCIYLDCWGRRTMDKFVASLYESFLLSESRRGTSLESILSTFAHLRPQASVDPKSGKVTFSVEVKTPQMRQSLEVIFNAIAEAGKRSKVVVVIDEFQEILRLPDADEMLAVMRGLIQFQREVTYFYLGSLRNLMDDIFNNPNRPFFKSAASIEVATIEERRLKQFLGKKFSLGDRFLSERAFDEIVDVARGITGDIQQLCSEVWNCTAAGDEIDLRAIHLGLERVHQTEHESNARIVGLLSPGQVKVLMGLARVGGKAPTSAEFLAASGVAQPSSVTKAFKRLVDDGLVYRGTEGYEFFNPFFRTWILKELD